MIDALLPQKRGGLSPIDRELFVLLSAQAAPALVRARERARAETQNAAVEQLLETKERTSGAPSVQGDLDETKLIDVFQLIGMTRKSGKLVASDRNQSVAFHFHNGSVFAVLDGEKPIALEDAPRLLSSWVERSGSFVFHSEPGQALASRSKQ